MEEKKPNETKQNPKIEITSASNLFGPCKIGCAERLREIKKITVRGKSKMNTLYDRLNS